MLSVSIPATDSSTTRVVALVGGTVIDGTGKAPLPDATIVIVGDRIASIGPRATTPIPQGARQVDVRGKYITPGFIDANMHLMTAGDQNMEVSSRVREALNFAFESLKHGVTTVRDTWGPLRGLLMARDSLAHGRALGARLLIAGNIIGLSSDPNSDLTEGTGRELLKLTDDSLHTVIDRYLDKGMDFIKISVTDHNAPEPQPLLFSETALQTMIREAHKRGLLVDSHTQTLEGLRMALRVGIDVFQHPELTHNQPVPDDILHEFQAKRVFCAIFAGDYGTSSDVKPDVTAENARKLIRSGCQVVVATDFTTFHRMWTDTEFGAWTLNAIEALVSLGMTPMQALVAATRTGAMACGAERNYGTLEAGKYADVLVLAANPLEDIHNIEKLDLIIHSGRMINGAGEELKNSP